METKFKIIETDSYVLAVSDAAGEIGCLRIEYMPHKPHCYTRIYNSLNGNTIHLFDKEVWKGKAGFTYKIIAYQPKNNAPELEGIPEIVVEDDVEKKTNRKVCKCKRAYENPLSEICSLCWNEIYPDEKDEVKEEDLINSKAATKVYSEEDLRKAIKFFEVYIANTGRSIFDKDISLYLEALKHPKWFVAKTEEQIPKGITFGLYGNDEPPTEWVLKTTTINGKTYLVGTYLYE